jgi:uncharacterized protein (DUF2336 family)
MSLFPSEGFLRFASLGSADRSATLLRALADLFNLHDTHRRDDLALFDELFLSLYPDASEADRADVAARLAPRADLPGRVALAIGLDRPAVAERFVGDSPALTPIDLVRIVAHGDTAVRRRVAARPGLDRSVALCLIETGDAWALEALLDNPDAALAPADLARIRRGAPTPDILNRLVRRPGMPADLAIAAFFDLDPDGRWIALEAAAGEAERARLRGGRQPALPDAPGFGPEAVALLAARDRDGFAAALGRALALPPPLAACILDDDSGEALAVALSALGVDGTAATSVFLLSDTVPGRSYWRTRALTILYPTIRRAPAALMLDHWRGNAGRPAESVRQVQDSRQEKRAAKAARRAKRNTPAIARRG